MIQTRLEFSPERFKQRSGQLFWAIIDLRDETEIVKRYGVRYYTNGTDMGLKLQGIAAKVAKLEHDAEFEASKLDAKIEEVAARMPGVFSGAHGSVDKLAQNVGDIEGAFSAIQSVSNGAPADPAEPTSIPGPYPTYP